MMNRFSLYGVGAAALALGLAGCGGGASLPPAVGPVIADITTVAPQVASAAQRLCQWQPMEADIAALIAVLYPAGAPIATMVSGAAQAICSQVGVAKASLRGGPPAAVMVDGVRVRHNTQAGRALAPLPNSVMVNGVLVRRQ